MDLYIKPDFIYDKESKGGQFEPPTPESVEITSMKILDGDSELEIILTPNQMDEVMKYHREEMEDFALEIAHNPDDY